MIMNFWKRTALAATCGLAIAGCGDKSGAPQGSSIVLSPPEITWTGDVQGAGFGGLTVYQVKVLGPNGLPINDVDITVDINADVDLIFGVPACEIYAGTVALVGGVVVDPVTLAPVLQIQEPFADQVDEFGEAKYTMRCIVGGGRVSEDYIHVFSGAAFGQGIYNVECTDDDSANPPDCP
jgi:hypothetical protein